MKIIVFNTSKSLLELMNNDQKKIIKKAKNHKRSGNFIIQNLGNQDIYVETGEPASVETGLLIKANGGLFSFTEADLNDVNLISDQNDNNNVRLGVF
jgi:hypothetical protein